MKAGGGKGKQASPAGGDWLQLIVWGTFLSALMFGLGFLTGSRWSEHSSPQSYGSIAIQGMPPRLEVRPSSPEESSQPASDHKEPWWDTLEGKGESDLQADSPPEPEKEQVSKPTPTKPAASVVSSSEAKRSVPYSVQVSSTRDRKRAKEMKRELAGKGYPSPRIQEIKIPGKGTWYRIRLGPFTGQTEAEQWAMKVRQRENLIPLVVRER
jgi:cell division protein FtsN